MSKSSRVTEQ